MDRLNASQKRLVQYLYENDGKTFTKSQLAKNDLFLSIDDMIYLRKEKIIFWEDIGEQKIKIEPNGRDLIAKAQAEAYQKDYNEKILNEAIIANKKARNANIIAIVAGALAFLSLSFDLIQFLFS